jgi:hypothetical protein
MADCVGPGCPECERPLRAGLLSQDVLLTGFSVTESGGFEAEGYRKETKMWWCSECAGVCIEDVDEAHWDAVRGEQRKVKVEVNCPGCNVTLDIYPVKTVYCPCCDRSFDRETRVIVSESEADRQKREGLDETT